MSKDEERWIKYQLRKLRSLPAGDRVGYMTELRECTDAALMAELARTFAKYDAETSALLENQILKDDISDILENPLGEVREFFPELAIGPFEEGELVNGRFRIQRILGLGGMGTVYLALDERFKEAVALKVLRDDLRENEQMRRRFEKEVHLARKIAHPNVCRIHEMHDAPATEARPAVSFFTMEYLEGETLSSRLVQGPIRIPEELPILQQIADGLAAAHKMGILHRDIKPANVLVTMERNGPRAVITDFGLVRPAPGATLAVAAELVTQAEQVAGTTMYMAPEVFEKQIPTAASDVYALGLLFHFALTGRLPFDNLTREGMYQMRSKGAPPSLRSLRGEIPKDWDRIVRKALEPDPAMRYGNALQFAEALRKSDATPATGEVETAAQPAFRKGSSRFSRPVLAALAIIPVLTILLAMSPLGEKTRLWFGATFGRGTVPQAQTRLAILPFHVSGSGEDLESRANGLIEIITHSMSQFDDNEHQVMVVPVSEARALKERTPDAAKRQLRVQRVVEGTLYGEGSRLRLSLSAVDTDRMIQLSSETIEGNREELFEFQDRAVRALARMMNLAYNPNNLRRFASSRPASPEAYDFYVQARGYLQRNDQLSSIDSAIRLLERSLQKDANYGPALAALSSAYWFKYERTKDQKWIAKTREFADTALRRDPHAFEVHLTLGRLANGTGKYDTAIKEFETALAADPRNLAAYVGLGKAFLELGNAPKAESSYLKAVTLNSGDWNAYKQLGLFYYRQGDYAKAIDNFDKVLDLSPDNAQAHNNLGVFHYRLGHVEEARNHWAESLAIEPRASTYSNLGKLEYDAENYAAALENYSKAAAFEPSHRIYESMGSIARRQGKADLAGNYYGKAIELVRQELLARPGDGDLQSYLAHYLALSGDKDGASTILKGLEHDASAEPARLLRNAESYLLMGDTANAKRLAEHALAGHSPESPAVMSKELRALLAQR